MQCIQFSQECEVWTRSSSFVTHFWQLMAFPIWTLSDNIDIAHSPLPLHVKCSRNYTIVRWECIIKGLISLINRLSIIILYLFSAVYLLVKVDIVPQLELLQQGKHVVIAKFVISIKIEHLVCKSTPHLGASFDEILEHLRIVVKRRSQENTEISIQEVHHSIRDFLAIARAQMGFERVSI